MSNSSSVFKDSHSDRIPLPGPISTIEENVLSPSETKSAIFRAMAGSDKKFCPSCLRGPGFQDVEGSGAEWPNER